MTAATLSTSKPPDKITGSGKSLGINAQMLQCSEYLEVPTQKLLPLVRVTMFVLRRGILRGALLQRFAEVGGNQFQQLGMDFAVAGADVSGLHEAVFAGEVADEAAGFGNHQATRCDVPRF